jgi:hypothetical protein
MIGYVSFFIVIAILAALTPYADNRDRLFLVMFVGVLLAFACFIVVASLRRRRFEVDEWGIRCNGRFRANFDVRWKDVARIEVLRYRRSAPQVYALRASDETVLATFSPAELGVTVGESLAAAVLSRASHLGLPIVHAN